ncbi:ATP-binding protein [Verrucomicrobia bacterium S94]|nr:ATP-binding protein [Verrucomicrobia bacterium S94]
MKLSYELLTNCRAAVNSSPTCFLSIVIHADTVSANRKPDYGVDEETFTKKTYYPSQFFIDTQWETLTNCKISYRVKLGDTIRSFNIRKPSQRWKYPKERLQRNVFILDISRTLPLDATVGYAKLAKQAQEEVSDVALSKENRDYLSFILGRKYSSARFATTDFDDSKQVGLLTREFGEMSQFHQGAGEDATLDLFQLFETLPNHSLLIIDEVEASLHPKAQRRLTKYLLSLSRLKRIQVVLSTHSPYVLEELPSEARILLTPNEQGSISVVPNVSTEFSMSKMDDSDNPELHIYVEDSDAQILAYEILKKHDPDDQVLPRAKCVVVGPANVVQTMGMLSHRKQLPYSGLGLLDGDIEESEGCINLPGTTPPEILVFNDLKIMNWPNLDSRFGVGAGTLFTILDESMLEPDHHNWTRIVGDKIRMSAKNVWQILCKEWVYECMDQTTGETIKEAILAKLNAA